MVRTPNWDDLKAALELQGGGLVFLPAIETDADRVAVLEGIDKAVKCGQILDPLVRRRDDDIARFQAGFRRDRVGPRFTDIDPFDILGIILSQFRALAQE